MSETTKLVKKGRNNPQKNILKTKSLNQKSNVVRSSQTPIKSQSSNKMHIHNNNTMINPNNNYNINNNISININIDMTNERNKSFNLKNKNQKKKQTNTKKDHNFISNNNFIFNAIKNISNKPNLKKSPFHIRIKSSNIGSKDYKYKPNDHTKNKVYQNRLNYYYNISNKNNFNIFSHKLENKKPENNNNTNNEHKNISINHTPIIERTKNIYKNIKEKQDKNKENIKEININRNNDIKKYIKKRNIYSQNLNREILNKKTNKKIQSTTPNHSSNKLNRSIDHRKLHNKINKRIENLKNNTINHRNLSSSPFFKNKQQLNYTTDFDKKNKSNKNSGIIKSPINQKFFNGIFKNQSKLNSTGTNFRSPMISSKNTSKLNKINKPNLQKENNKKKENGQINQEKIKKEDNTLLNKDNKDNYKSYEIKQGEKEKPNSNPKLETKENKNKDNNLKDSSPESNNKDKKEKHKENEKGEITQLNKDKKEETKEKKEIENQKEQKEINDSKTQADVNNFLNEIFQQSLPKEIPSKPSITKKITHLQSICKIGYAGPGVKKKNQDNFFIYKNFLNNSDLIFLGVCDGHGMFGHDISGYLVNTLPQNLHSNLLKENIPSINLDSDFQKISDIASNTFVQTNLNMVNSTSIDCTYSGTTCSSLIFSPEKIISLNVGDSRCVLGKCIEEKWTAKNLTRDHKPTEEDEKKRILEKGGRIEPYKDEAGEPVGPERVWLKGEDLPGLAMSRSFGDDVAHMIGVTSKPEIMEYKFCEEDKFIMLASDGIFEFITSDEAVNMVKDFYLKDDIEGALNYLYKISSQRWIMEEDVIDDITLIIMFLK